MKYISIFLDLSYILDDLQGECCSAFWDWILHMVHYPNVFIYCKLHILHYLL